MKHNYKVLVSVSLLVFCQFSAISGCGSKTESSGGASAEAQGKMSPEEVQKELQKISPPAGGKSKAKAK
ncbi:MAG: hypothetical protein NT172_06180 [Planctomycetota bacterium]|nr:hypothetical protein [Planctomycetota bacterium]